MREEITVLFERVKEPNLEIQGRPPEEVLFKADTRRLRS